jgi:hypothetical protein
MPKKKNGRKKNGRMEEGKDGRKKCIVFFQSSSLPTFQSLFSNLPLLKVA